MSKTFRFSNEDGVDTTKVKRGHDFMRQLRRGGKHSDSSKYKRKGRNKNPKRNEAA